MFKPIAKRAASAIFAAIAFSGPCLCLAAPATIQPGAPQQSVSPNPLGLSPAQQDKAHTIEMKYQGLFGALQANTSLSKQQKQAKEKTLATQMQTEMLALLTPAQHAQYSHDMKTQAAIQASLMKKRAAFMKAHQSDITSVRQLQVQFNNSITPAQHAQMEKIKADVMAQENQLRANLTMSQQDKIQQDQTIMAQARAKAAQLLTPTQKAMIQHIQQLTSKLNVAAQAALTH